MKILLDTCTFLWIITGSDQLSDKAKELFLETDNEVYLSVVSVWEIVLKYKLGRLPLPEDPDAFIPVQCLLHDVEFFNLSPLAVYELAELPDLHQDPFDRMLVCQAKTHRMTILTPDKEIEKYDVKSVW